MYRRINISTLPECKTKSLEFSYWVYVVYVSLRTVCHCELTVFCIINLTGIHSQYIKVSWVHDFSLNLFLMMESKKHLIASQPSLLHGRMDSSSRILLTDSTVRLLLILDGTWTWYTLIVYLPCTMILLLLCLIWFCFYTISSVLTFFFALLERKK